MIVINLTPHFVNLHLKNAEGVRIPVTGLPEPMLGVYYIVSYVVKAAYPDRTDLLCPDSDTAKRDESGNS